MALMEYGKLTNPSIDGMRKSVKKSLGKKAGVKSKSLEELVKGLPKLGGGPAAAALKK